MKVSIIIPIYNGEKYLEECLKSILNQTFLDYELILINDGSTDNTHSICTKYRDLDERIKYLNTDNNGVSIARNLGIEKSNGEYIWFVDADDLISPDFLNGIFVNRKLDFDILQFDYLQFDYELSSFDKEKLEVVREYKGLKSFIENEKYTRSLWRNIFRRDIIVNNNISFVPKLKFGEDLLFTLENIFNSLTLIRCDYVGYYYRQHSDSVMRKSRTLEDAINHITILNRLIFIYNTIQNDNMVKKNIIIHEIKSISTTFIAFSALSRNKIRLCDVQRSFNKFYDDNLHNGNVFLKKILRLQIYRVSVLPIYYFYKLKKIK